MKLLIIKLFVVFIRALYAFMKVRKTENKIVWLSRQSNEKSEDMKMLSEEISRLSPETKQVFRLCRLKDESGLSISYIFFILRDMWEIASARIAITDTYSIPVSCLNHKADLKVFQIWHALGAVKKFSLQSAGKAQGRDINVARAMCMHKNYDFVVAPSQKNAEFYCEAFGCSKDKIVIASLPRVDVILDGSSRYDEFVKLNPQCENKRIITYLPTFRDGDSEYIKKLYKAFENDSEYALVVSPHPLTKGADEYNFKGSFSSYDLAKLSYEIITDYSATSLECSLLNKPLWFYIPDYEKYKEEQGFNIDIKEEMKFASFVNENELLTAVKSGYYDFESLKAFSDKYIENQGTDNTEKLAEIICNQL
ncbi:MAG: CDP-glycerol glycerophosphotransferase family protein [Clostridia bacterium]|nr:CDP-glycerol glycerophosphotransferase family protein [Clostridia bacterium]